jgi:hypothetical protein
MYYLLRATGGAIFLGRFKPNGETLKVNLSAICSLGTFGKTGLRCLQTSKTLKSQEHTLDRHGQIEVITWVCVYYELESKI